MTTTSIPKISILVQAHRIHGRNMQMIRRYKAKHGIPFQYPLAPVEGMPVPRWAQDMMRSEWARLTDIPF